MQDDAPRIDPETGEVYEPLTPISVETKMRSIINKLTRVQKALADARDQETDAEIAYRAAVRDANKHPDAPVVRRGGVTVDERKAWVEDRAFDEWERNRRAANNRQKAEDLLRITRDQSPLAASIAKSVTEAYRVAGRAES